MLSNTSTFLNQIKEILRKIRSKSFQVKYFQDFIACSQNVQHHGSLTGRDWVSQALLGKFVHQLLHISSHQVQLQPLGMYMWPMMAVVRQRNKMSSFLIKNHLLGHLSGSVGLSTQLPAQVLISQFVSSSPASGAVLTAQSLEPASNSVFLSLCPSPTCTLSRKNKLQKKIFFFLIKFF